jgi:ribosomal protein S18 acetylase RimI-like enzyme
LTGVTAAVHLCCRWEAGSTPAVVDLPGVESREVRTTDVPAVGRLMWSAFRGSSDDEFDTVADAELEVLETLDGKWGPFLSPARLVAVMGSEVVSAVLTVLDDAHDRTPVLAFAVTAPHCQGQGLGSWLIEKAVRILDALGITELHLAVAPMNPARRLYERLGFLEVAGP